MENLRDGAPFHILCAVIKCSPPFSFETQVLPFTLFISFNHIQPSDHKLLDMIQNLDIGINTLLYT